MPLPSNTTAATAMVITALPFSVTQDVGDQASTLELWYTYVGQANDRMLGCVPYADTASVYEPKLFVYTGTSSSLTIFKINGATQRAGEIPITGGTEYFFKVTQNGAGTPLGSSLTFKAIRAPQDIAPLDSIIAAEENLNVRTPVVSTSVDNQIHYYIDDIEFMRSAMGTTLANGNFIGDGDFVLDVLTIYDSQIAQVFRGLPSYFAFMPEYITSDTTKFYLVYDGAFPADKTVRTLTATGAETVDVWTPANSGGAGTLYSSPNQTGTIFYYANPAIDSAIRRWDLTNDVGLSDLAAAVANYVVDSDMLVLADGSVVVSYRRAAVPHAFVRRYSAAGATLNTYDFGVEDIDHMALSYSNPLSFWVWVHTDRVTGTYTRSLYRQILASDGSTLTDAEYDHFANGPSQVTYDGNYATVDDVPLFGVAPSCTFFVTTATVTPSTIIYPDFEIAEDPIRWLRRAPIQSSENRRFFVNFFALDIEAGTGLPSGAEEDTNPQVMMRYSDDGGPWSNELWRAMGTVGRFFTRLEWWRLGKFRNLVIEVSGSAAVKTTLIDGYVDVQPSTDEPRA